MSVAAAVSAGGTVAVAAPAAAAGAAACSLTTPSPRSEDPASCVAADVALDRLPAVGESATVTVRLRSQVDVGRARLAVRLPDSLRLDARSSGLSAPRAVGLDQVSDRVLALRTEGETVTFGVTAISAGPAHIQADVSGVDTPAPDRSAHATSTFTVGERGTASHDRKLGTREQAVVRARPGAGVATAGAGEICAKGSFTYADAAGTWKPGRNIKVQVAGKTTSSAAAKFYATGTTSTSDGSYSVCFASPVSTMYQVWVEFASDSALWRVTNNAGTSVYTLSTPAKSSVASGSDAAFGTTSPTSTYMRAWHTYDTLNKLWAAHGSSPCWTTRQTSGCRAIVLHWEPGSTEGTYWDNSVAIAQRYIALTDDDPDSEHTIIHESGHALMDMLYAGWWPKDDCPSPHYLHKATGPTCAWTEGFANAVAGYVIGDGRYYWSDGQWIDLMSTTPFDPSQPAGRTNIADGDQVECRVAGALIDVWRKVDGGPLRTFELMTAEQSSTFKEHVTVDRKAAGLDVSASTLDLIATHTIDYRSGGGTPSTIVANGGFENGTTGWTITGNTVGNWSDYPAQAGTWYAWFGGDGRASTDTLSQKVTIPASAGSATLGFHLRIATQETEATAYDTLRVQVVDSATATLRTYSNVNASSGYQAQSVDLSAYRGKTVTLRFTSTEDSSLITDFLVDNVAITTA